MKTKLIRRDRAILIPGPGGLQYWQPVIDYIEVPDEFGSDGESVETWDWSPTQPMSPRK